MRSAPLLAFVVASSSSLLLAASSSETVPEPASVLFNHFFVVTDAATYAEAQASRFLTKEFAPFEKRTTVRNDQTYTGIYFYGRRTYFELFEPGAQGPTGTSGLAFGVEAPDGSALVKARWAEAAGGAEGGPVTRRTDSEEVPWFEMTYAKGGRPTPTTAVLRVWLMEYHRDFLARWYPDLTPARSITRADVLDRYVARIGQAARRGGFLMKDVTSLTLALPGEDQEALATQLRAVGYSSREDKGAAVLTGPDVRLRVVPAAEGGARGILEVEFSLQSRVLRAQHRLGSAVLTVEADRARLRFGGDSR
jgi:hypothetical protein